MQSIEQALEEVRALHEQVTRSPAPDLAPQALLPIPPGLDPVAFAIEEVSRLKQVIENFQAAAPPAGRSWMPPTNVFTGESSLIFLVELPGMAKEDVSVTVSDGELVVRGTRDPGTTDNHVTPLLVEQGWGVFERRFPVPTWCHPETVSARCSQGLLEIRLARPEEEASGEFNVKIG